MFIDSNIWDCVYLIVYFVSLTSNLLIKGRIFYFTKEAPLPLRKSSILWRYRVLFVFLYILSPKTVKIGRLHLILWNLIVFDS